MQLKKYELVNIKILKLSDFKEDIDKGSESWILTRTECINTVPNQEIIMSFSFLLPSSRRQQELTDQQPLEPPHPMPSLVIIFQFLPVFQFAQSQI